MWRRKAPPARSVAELATPGTLNVEAQVNAWPAKAPDGPLSSHLVEASQFRGELTKDELFAFVGLVELQRQSSLSNATLGPALARLASTAVELLSNPSVDGFDTMELD